MIELGIVRHVRSGQSGVDVAVDVAPDVAVGGTGVTVGGMKVALGVIAVEGGARVGVALGPRVLVGGGGGRTGSYWAIAPLLPTAQPPTSGRIAMPEGE